MPVGESFIIEGRYRKPWEGIALATLVFLCTVPKRVILKSAITDNHN